MVKPPKTMQPESISDMSKAGRDRQKAFGEDSFHTYLARKIDLQRHQFGVQVPPPPEEQPSSRSISITLPPTTLSPESKAPPKSVRFSFDTSTPKPKSHKKFGVSAVLKRLQRRHGVTKITTKGRGEDMDSSCESEQNEISAASDDKTISVYSTSLSTEQSDEKYANVVENCNTSSTGKRRSKLSERPDLFFRGVIVLINGYTHPDGETLQRLMQQHGGDVERYETSRITHVIAEQLSTAKANLYKKQKRNPTPVCRPSWIVDSVAAFQLLPYQEYLLDDVKKDKDVVSVASFFQRSSHGRLVEGQDQTNRQTDSVGGDTNESSACDNNEAVEKGMIGPCAAMERPPPEEDVSDVAVKRSTEERFINGRVRTVGTDPNFLEGFFAASRLSFIGSYRQRTRSSPTKQNEGHNRSDAEVQRFVFHVDMDCFFASVVLRNYPQYRHKPVAISHSGIKQGISGTERHGTHKDSSSECATCNYEARKYGLKKGMFLGQAKALCPDLIVLQYDFEGYEEVSDAVSEILHRYALENSGNVEHVSCDEAYLEFHIPFRNGQTPSVVAGEIAEAIREEIYALTQCTATVGVGTNKFLAKLATDHVKPNRSFVMGDFYHILKSTQLKDLYGIGYKMKHRLGDESLVSVQDIWDLGDQGELELCRILGPALGKKVFGFCHGKDDRPVQASVRKTIGAEVG
jgi:DNA repair protein REV1